MPSHKTAREVSCLDCQARFDADEMVGRFQQTGQVPCCVACGSGLVKHATISFGQQLPPDVLHEAFALSRRADLFLAIGSSLVVEPAASLPRAAKESGARLVIMNRDPTPLDSLADVVLHEPIGITLAEIAGQTIESGTIVAALSGNTCIVELTDGRQVQAVLDLKALARNSGCLFGSPVGWAVYVRIMQAPKLSRVVSLRPQSG